MSCTGGEMEQKKITHNSFKNIPDSAWEKLSQMKIFFGHQSVGFNIIDGIKDLIEEYPKVKLNIVETSDINDLNSGVFAHSKVGKNTDPKSKIDSFSKFINNGIGSVADVVALKFCYLDITENTNITKIMIEYKTKINKIKEEHPKIRIIHFTVPLTVIQTGWKASIKKIIGKSIGGVSDNIKRYEYNELLYKEYEGVDSIFDIAKFESTFDEGIRCKFEKEGKIYYSLVPIYSDDGKHLNELGRKKIAEQLLLQLVNLD
jgi:hypothetical protein